MILQEYSVGLEMLLEINKCDECYIPMSCLFGGFFFWGGGSSDRLVFYLGRYRTTFMYSCLGKQHILYLHFSTCSFDNV